MGLDCYVFAESSDAAKNEKPAEIWYGRKENEIHGWMQAKSGIPAGEFNCVEFDLTLELLDELSTVGDKNMPHTTGFFFGPSGDWEEVKAARDALVAAAHIHLSSGERVYYYSWW